MTKKRIHTMAQAGSPFGDGRAAERIVNILFSRLWGVSSLGVADTGVGQVVKRSLAVQI
jgi:hypothetical protein